MTTLTEQYRKGKLPRSKLYYVKNNNEIFYCYLDSNNDFIHYGGIIHPEVIDEVPSYEKWLKFKNATANIMLQNNILEIISDQLKKENTKLKELLKECCYRIDWRTRTGHKPSDEKKQKLFDKINQVLGGE